MGNNLFKEVIVEDEAEIVGGPSDTNSQQRNENQPYNSRLSGNNNQKNKQQHYGQNKKSYDQYGYSQSNPMSGQRNGGIQREKTGERDHSEGFNSTSPTP